MTRMRAISVNENASFYGILQPTVFSDNYLLDPILDRYIRLQHSQEALNIIKENIKIAQRLIVDKKIFILLKTSLNIKRTYSMTIAIVQK